MESLVNLIKEQKKLRKPHEIYLYWTTLKLHCWDDHNYLAYDFGPRYNLEKKDYMALFGNYNLKITRLYYFVY